jgi:hypothetical protein
MEKKIIPKRLSITFLRKETSLDTLTEQIGISLDIIETTPFKSV